ncbi:MAG TPA: PKD domain-containing protein, partial [Solirubrobacterales bacterium]|nr:PKD domain-containing protein [Solirubrobacterales bacterium]
SADGESWTDIGTTGTDLTGIEDPMIGVYATASNQAGAGQPTASFHSVAIEPECPGENNPPVIESISADPDSGEAPLEVDFSVSASDPDGDALSYSWDFGDGNTSTEEDPTHTYTDPGTYEAEVTVSDGELEVSDSVTVTVEPPAEDTTPPVTTVQLNGAAPQASYDGDVTATFAANDPGPDASGVDYTEYRIDSDDPGDWQTYNELSPPVVSAPGAHEIDYRSADNAGNVEQAKTVAFEITEDEVEGPELSVRGVPKVRKVGAKKKQTKFRFLATNVGDADTGPVRLCAKAPKRKLKIKGPRCLTRQNIAPGQTGKRIVQVRIKPAARGKTTRVKLIARGPNVETKKTTVRVKAR